jgi:uncharacterized small protein (DUF1192 family)
MEDDLPRKRGPGDELGAASRLAGEPLDHYSQDELLERIRLLEAEIVRVRAHHAKAADQRRLADALFRPRDPD